MKDIHHLYLRFNFAQPNLIIQDLQQLEQTYDLSLIKSIFCTLEYELPSQDNNLEQIEVYYKTSYNSVQNGMVFQYFFNMIHRLMKANLLEVSFELTHGVVSAIQFFNDIVECIKHDSDIFYKLRFCLPLIQDQKIESIYKICIQVLQKSSLFSKFHLSLTCHSKDISNVVVYKFISDISHISIEYSTHVEPSQIKKEWNVVYSKLRQIGLKPYMLWHFALPKCKGVYLESVYQLQNYIGLCLGYLEGVSDKVSSWYYNDSKKAFYVGRHSGKHVENKNEDIMWKNVSLDEAFSLYVRKASSTQMGMLLLPCFQQERYIKVLEKYHFSRNTDNVNLCYVRDKHLWYNTIN